MNSEEMSISSFARRSFLSIKALRLYDEIGLLKPDRIDGSSRYRYYSEAQLEKARLISLLRKLDVPLAEIAKIVDGDADDAVDQLTAWWRREEDHMARRRDLLEYIRSTVMRKEDSEVTLTPGYEILLRRRPETSYLVRSRHVHGPELPGFIQESVAELQELADHHGNPVVFFHGVVDLDSDGPVDVCMPVEAGALSDEVDTRTEAPHEQAYIVLQKHQVEFPQILMVYRALRQWIDLNGYAISGPPREQYLGRFDAVDGSDPICEVAFPIYSVKGTSE